MSFAVCTKHKVCPVIGGKNKKAGALATRLMTLSSALMAGRATNLCEASFGERYFLRIHDLSSHDDFERGFMTSVDNEEKKKFNVNKSSLKEKSLPRETASPPTTHVHLRSVACHRGWFSTAPFCFYIVLAKNFAPSLHIHLKRTSMRLGKTRVFRTFCSIKVGKPPPTTLKFSGVAKNTTFYSAKCFFG